MRSLIAAITRPACSSSSRSHALEWSGDSIEDLVDPPRSRLGEHRAPVLHDEGVFSFEGRVEVGNDPDKPTAARTVGLERGRDRAFVPGAEGTRAGSVRLHHGHPWGEHERSGTARTVDAHHDPSTRQGIKAKLIHFPLQRTFATAARVLSRGAADPVSRIDVSPVCRIPSPAPRAGPALCGLGAQRHFAVIDTNVVACKARRGACSHFPPDAMEFSCSGPTLAACRRAP